MHHLHWVVVVDAHLRPFVDFAAIRLTHLLDLGGVAQIDHGVGLLWDHHLHTFSRILVPVHVIEADGESSEFYRFLVHSGKAEDNIHAMPCFLREDPEAPVEAIGEGVPGLVVRDSMDVHVDDTMHVLVVLNRLVNNAFLTMVWSVVSQVVVQDLFQHQIRLISTIKFPAIACTKSQQNAEHWPQVPHGAVGRAPRHEPFSG
mmetsp:Transcript_35189/g.56501  ORF Transcript_35189/g.56501 Transcript_35189/m.56501 type:complete len:202 (-) Transcript_35189:16-621(-)